MSIYELYGKELPYVMVPKICIDGTVKLSSSELAVYIALLSFGSKKKPNPYPTYQAISARANVSPKTVQRAIESLAADHGLIKVTKRYNKDAKKYDSNQYTFTLPQPQNSATPLEADTALPEPNIALVPKPDTADQIAVPGHLEEYAKAYTRPNRILVYKPKIEDIEIMNSLYEHGIDPNYVATFIRYQKEDDFWKNKTVSLSYIAKHIGSWLMLPEADTAYTAVPDHIAELIKAYVSPKTNGIIGYEPTESDLKVFEALHKAGIEPGTLAKFIKNRKKDEWWQDKIVTLKHIKENIYSWRKAG